jgi:hypothetical protein
MAETTVLETEIWRFKSSHSHNALVGEWHSRTLEVGEFVGSSPTQSTNVGRDGMVDVPVCETGLCEFKSRRSTQCPSIPTAEKEVLKTLKCGFDSHLGHMLKYANGKADCFKNSCL